MTSKTLSQNAAEFLLSGQAYLECAVCGESNWSKAAPSHQTKRLGFLTVRCKTCANVASLAYCNERYATDDDFRASKKTSTLAHHNERYATDETYREYHSSYQKERRATDEAFRAAQNAKNLQWAKDNPGKAKAKGAKRRSKKLQATPEWADLSAIQAFYEGCPAGYHVDHIVPLQGRTVCGLHVLINLQYLTATENLSKGNKHA